jgi:hypothetical protein
MPPFTLVWCSLSLSLAIKNIVSNRSHIHLSKLSAQVLIFNWVFPLVMPIYKNIKGRHLINGVLKAFKAGASTA